MRGDDRRVLFDVEDLDAVGEAGGEVVGEVEFRAVGDVPVFVRQLGASFRHHALGAAIVDDAIGLQHAVLVIEHHVPGRGDDVAILVVDELIGLDVELVRILRRGLRLRSRGVRRTDRRQDPRKTRHQQDKRESEARNNASSASALVRKVDGAAHQPSSWCRST